MKKLAKGDSAPTYTVRDAYDNIIAFDSVRPKSTLLAFLRYSTCPFCNLALHRLTVEYPILQDSGIDVIAFVQSSSENIRQHIYEEHAVVPPFPIIPRQHPNVYKMYGVNPTLEETPSLFATVPAWLHRIKEGGLGTLNTVDGNLFLAPALFLVSPTGSIELAKYVTNVYNDELFSEIYDAGARAAIL